MINNKGEEVGIIYGWYNTKNEKWYIGQTINPEQRFKDHIKLSINMDRTKFHNALRKYGLDNFIYCVLENNVLRENLNMKEQEWIEYYDSFYDGYNMTAGGGGVNQITITEETRKKMSIAKKGNVPWNKGKQGIYSEESRKKMSESRKGKSPWNKGKRYNMSEIGKLHLKEFHKDVWTGRHHQKKSIYRMSVNARTAKKVDQYTLDGKFVKRYNTMKECAQLNNLTDYRKVRNVCIGKLKSINNYIYKFAS